jgi:hypothetical protein
VTLKERIFSNFDLKIGKRPGLGVGAAVRSKTFGDMTPQEEPQRLQMDEMKVFVK